VSYLRSTLEQLPAVYSPHINYSRITHSRQCWNLLISHHIYCYRA